MTGAARRDALRDAIVATLREHGRVRAIWEGGSAATGRFDDRSDIDLQFAVEDAAGAGGDELFAALEQMLDDAGPIRRRHHVPEPAWHGHRQRFYQLVGMPDDHMVDVVVVDPETPPAGRFLEPERHGHAIFHHDVLGWSQDVPALDRTAHDARMHAELAQLRERVPMFAHLVTKALDRGQPLDAIGLHQRLVVPALVTLLGMVHRPERYDFALRYLHDDLPVADQRRLEHICYVADTAALRAASADALDWFEELSTALA